jgi:hypothetical protein
MFVLHHFVSSGDHRYSVNNVITRSIPLTFYILDSWTEMDKKQSQRALVILSEKKTGVVVLFEIYNNVYAINFSHFDISKIIFSFNGIDNLAMSHSQVPPNSAAPPPNLEGR